MSPRRGVPRRTLLEAAREAARTSRQHRVRRLDNARHHGGARAPGQVVDLVVWHGTGGDYLAGAWSWLNRVLKAGEFPGSYHYGIDKDGRIDRVLGVGQIAYHAGLSEWPVPPGGVRPHRSVNKRSIGVAFANDNDSDAITTDDPLTYEQCVSGLWLARVLTLNSGVIRVQDHVGHREVAPRRKVDPVPQCVEMDDWRAAIDLTLVEYYRRVP